MENKNDTFSMTYGKKSIITEEEIELTAKLQLISAKYHKADLELCFRKCKNRAESDARTFVWYILHREYGFSMNKLAFLYKRTQRSINRGVSCLSYLIETQKTYEKTYYKIKEKIKNDVSRNELQDAIKVLCGQEKGLSCRLHDKRVSRIS